MSDRQLSFEEGQTLSVVAHSFGTYILGYSLLRFDFIRFNKVILCGSILPRDFPWNLLIERGQVQAVRNEYGVRDPWVKRVSWFVKGTGPSGEFGFTCQHSRLDQEEFDYAHSEYFGRDHMQSRWIPFLDRPLEVIPQSTGARIPRPQQSRPWGSWGLCGLLLATITTPVLFWGFSGRDASGLELSPPPDTANIPPLPEHNELECAQNAEEVLKASAIEAPTKVASITVENQTSRPIRIFRFAHTCQPKHLNLPKVLQLDFSKMERVWNLDAGDSRDFNKVMPGFSFFRIASGVEGPANRSINLFGDQWYQLRPGCKYRIRILRFNPPSEHSKGDVDRDEFEEIKL